MYDVVSARASMGASCMCVALFAQLDEGLGPFSGQKVGPKERIPMTKSVQCCGLKCRKKALFTTEFRGLKIQVCQFHLRGLADKVRPKDPDAQIRELRLASKGKKREPKRVPRQTLSPASMGFKNDPREFKKGTVKPWLIAASTNPCSK